MSQDVKQKKQRIGGINIPTIEFKEESVVDSKETKRWENTNVSLEEFDWDTHAADCPSRMRRGNPFVKAPRGTKIFYQGADAQKWFDLYEGIMADFKAVIEPNEHHDGTIYSMSNDWAMLDVGHREMVYIDLGREPSSIRSLIEVGAKFTVRILSTKNQKGFILGSIGEGMRQTIINDLKKSDEKINDILFDLLGGYCGKTAEQVKNDATRDLWHDSKEALKKGIIDEIITKSKKKKK